MTAQTPLDRLKAAMGEGWEVSIMQPPDYTDRWYAKATRLHGRAMDSGIVIESECCPTESAAVDALLAARDAAFPSIDAAVAAERERCAKVAGHIAAEYRARASERHSKAFHGTADDLNSVAAGAAEAAAAIRSATPDETPPAAGRTKT